MKKLLLILGLAFICSVADAQSKEDSAYIRQNYTKMEKHIPMRDGKTLFVAIYMPKDQSKKYPIIGE